MTSATENRKSPAEAKGDCTICKGLLTAEQVRECVERVYLEGYSDGSINRGAHIEETDWQAIANGLNKALGAGKCEERAEAFTLLTNGTLCVGSKQLIARIAELQSRLNNVALGGEINGDTSDGYHTFNELYHHRAVLFSVIVRDHRELAWKSRKHHDGTMYDGMFIVGIETPKGQATYHYDIDPYWEMFDCEEREYAPEWDGHTPDDAIARIAELGSRM